jgi:hypothetical protein
MGQNGMSNVDPQLAKHIEDIWRHGPVGEGDNLICGIARYVGKLADLSVSDAGLRVMQEFFGVEEAVELCERIRDEGMRFDLRSLHSQ